MFFSPLDIFHALASLRCRWFKYACPALIGCFSLLQERLKQHFRLHSYLDLPYSATCFLCRFQNCTINCYSFPLFLLDRFYQARANAASFTPALKYHAAKQCRLEHWHWLCQAPPQEILVATDCSLKDHRTSSPKQEGKRGKMISKESWRCFGISWFLRMLLMAVSQRGTLKQDGSPHVCKGQHTPRYSQPQGFSGIRALLLHGTVDLGIPCPICTPRGMAKVLQGSIAVVWQCWAWWGARTARFVEHFLWQRQQYTQSVHLGHARRNAFSWP